MDRTERTEQMIASMKNYGVQDESILHAFRTIPRENFVPTFYDRSAQHPRRWQTVTSDQPDWLEKVYTDRPLTTSLNAHGDPDSSSSQPHLMALMLQSVRIRLGMRVLEIGTGTGYNAALLAHLVSPQQVVTIEINAALLENARRRIERAVGPGVTLLQADGRILPKDVGVFDAIVVTGAHTRVEPSWINALVPQGRLVFNLEFGRFCKVMLEAQESLSGLTGNVCSYGGDFMTLHDGHGVQETRSPLPRLELIAPVECRPLLEDRDTLFFLHSNLPGMVLTRYRTKEERSYTLTHADRVLHLAPAQVRGDTSLWKEVSAVFETFEQLGKPRRSSFTFTTDTQGVLRFRCKDWSSHIL